MTLADMWRETLVALKTSPILHGAISTGKALLIVFLALAVLTGVTFLLAKYFKHHEGIKRAHKFLIYVMTMIGVAVLLLGGILGLVLPVIPGIFLLFLAFLLLRRYYRNRWVDGQIRRLSWRLRFKRSVKRAKQRVKRSKIGKALRKRHRRKRHGRRTHERNV